MFENFIKQDVDDMIFGSTEQIISERWDRRKEPRQGRGFFVFIAADAEKTVRTGVFAPQDGFFLLSSGECDILFRLMQNEM